MVQIEQEYERLLLDLRQAETEFQAIVPRYQAAKSSAWMDEEFRQWIKGFPAARNSSTVMEQVVDAWIDHRYERLATQHRTASLKVQGLREILRRYEPLIELVKQQAILSSVEAKIANVYG